MIHPWAVAPSSWTCIFKMAANMAAIFDMAVDQSLIFRISTGLFAYRRSIFSTSAPSSWICFFSKWLPTWPLYSKWPQTKLDFSVFRWDFLHAVSSWHWLQAHELHWPALAPIVKVVSLQCQIHNLSLSAWGLRILFSDKCLYYIFHVCEACLSVQGLGSVEIVLL